MAYTAPKGKWVSMAGVTEQSPWDTTPQGYWGADPNVDYGQTPEAGMRPFFDEQGNFAGWTGGKTGDSGSGLFGDFGGTESVKQYFVDPATGQLMDPTMQYHEPSRSGMTNFMSYAMPIAMMAGLGAGAAGGAFSGIGAAPGGVGGAASGTGGAITGAAEGMWPGLATAGGGGVPGGYAGAIGAGAAPSGAGLSAGTLSGGLGGALGGFGNYSGLAGQLGNAMTGAPEVSYGPGQNPTGMGEYAGSGASAAGSGGGSGTNPWVSGAQRVAGGVGNLLGGNTGSLIGGLLGAGLGYADAKSQPDSLTIKNEIDPRLANYAYGANGTGGIAGAANNLMNQQLSGTNPLSEAGKQISGMANTMPNWGQLVDQSKAQWDANPWIEQQQGAITNKVTQNLLQNVMPNIGSQANAMGGYGGSRQGIAQGLAMSNMNTDLGSSLAQLASQGWENSQNRALQGAQSAGSYGLQNQLQQAGLLGTGANMQQSGLWAPIQNATNVMGALPGNTSQTQPLFNNPWAGAIGGGSLGSQVGGSIDWGKLFEGLFK